MNHKRNPYDETGQRVFLVKELKRIFGRCSQTTQLTNHLVVSYDARYTPNNFRFACALPLRMLCDGNLRNPILFIPDQYIGGLIGVDFEPDVIVETMLGNFDRERELFFSLDEADEVWRAPHILIKIRWNAIGYSRTVTFTRLEDAILHCSIINNTGRRGTDYWILPVDSLRQKAAPEDMFTLLKFHATKISASYNVIPRRSNATDEISGTAVAGNTTSATTDKHAPIIFTDGAVASYMHQKT